MPSKSASHLLLNVFNVFWLVRWLKTWLLRCSYSSHCVVAGPCAVLKAAAKVWRATRVCLWSTHAFTPDLPAFMQ